LSATDNYIAITRLEHAYADVVNRRAWPELATLFDANAPIRIDTVTNPVVEVVGPTALGEFIGNAIERFEFFEFAILSVHVELEQDVARARLYMCELRQERATGEFSRAFGLYRDRFERFEGRWQFAARKYQSLARTGGEVFEFPEEIW
jgi:hypothetical protein